MSKKIHPIQRNEFIDRVISEIESFGEYSASIHLAIKQLTSTATGKIFRELDFPNMINVNSFDFMPNDGFNDNNDRISYLKAIKTAE